MNVHELVEVALHFGASDLVLKVGAPPALRVDGRMRLLELPPLTTIDTRDLALGVIFSSSRDDLLRDPDPDSRLAPVDEAEAERKMAALRSNHELDLVFTIADVVRVRANLFLQRGTVGAALRLVPLHPGTIEELHLPPVLRSIAQQPHGLVLLTGPTGSGKTTTMAAIIQEINRTRFANIFTIEDPIEYVFTDLKSVIHQREVGTDTESFSSALHSVMRQTPDVIAIGEMRELATMEVALAASEIGHLVIATLHTVSAPATVDRILNAFPQHLRKQVADQLAAALLCVTSQRLLPLARSSGRVPAVEVMMNSPTIRKSIEDDHLADLYASIREGQHFHMNTMNQALERLVHAGQITYEVAAQNSGNLAELRHMLRQA
jgi:twitching motility protein PilT